MSFLVKGKLSKSKNSTYEIRAIDNGIGMLTGSEEIPKVICNARE
jgi:hypothetical protein